MDINQYMGMFLEESREHLQTLNNCLLDLENDPGSLAVLDEIFRSAHTIKGMSATMGFTTIAELTHEMENVLDLLRKGTLLANDDITDILFKCVDTLEQLVENVASNSDVTIDIKPLISKLSAIAKGEPSPAVAKQPVPPVVTQEKENIDVAAIKLDETEINVVKAAKKQGLECYEVHISLREGCLLKSARAYMVMNALEELGEVIKSVPAVEELEKENFDYSFQVLILTGVDDEKIETTVTNISEVEKVTVIPSPILPDTAQDAAKTATDTQPASPAAGKPEKKMADKHEKPAANEHNDKKLKGGQSVRVDIDKLDSLLNLVGELVINKTRLEQIGLTHRLTDLVETIEQMDRVTTDLQTVVMKVRMVPVGQVFNRFPRMVRDLSRELNKEINLIIQGEETELDRTVIDEIGDPLVHLLRNSIDHGIEHPDERQAKGKNPVGEVRLIARHEGNNVIIMVEDDGKGINADVIKQKAVEKGMITQAEADKLEPNEAVRLVFLPGFSTAETVTDVSGRGVGMDAVKTKIESLGGMVDVETKINEGSRFKIRLPLTLAIIQALLVKVCEEIYAIPLGAIDSTINITPQDIKTIQNQEAILLRGQIIPIVRLANMLNVPNTCQHNQEELFVVIVHMGEHRAGIIVDTLIGQQEIVIKSMGKLLAGIKVIAGATILGNGQVALILDVGALKQ
ncbi:chemotaxis protein CheA [Sporomusa acidovorans]|uniref:Chemotaxis protein CheA n=1 Tax=Sporomusa acidovorans (strain ATCC 49682 / DSM 3132 / Mol) TaxID=1123286 RepID=A0ABZ3J393_SPOA4|nr:chemotaxis protein CheA [Sporomusa acidovorans]OZC20085.1 chemotaxis protein CheA [Sporomusa acidovorans DSM 3132]SDD45631.1 two-component system, chemotaxis family, sensor kinase CheA [Sporomusa acidovorans]